MENNPELQLAWQFIENTGTHLFLTGKAGTGKTTFLKRLREHTPKRMVVLAPTGIAAINAGGVTIHSFFQISFAPFVPETTFNSAQIQYRYSQEKRNIIRSMDLLVIDEISMVRADLLDAVDATLRRYRNREKPFGGVQRKHPIKYPFSLLYFHCTFAFAILHELLTYFHYDTRTI